MSLLGGEIAAIVGAEMAFLFFDATLSRQGTAAGAAEGLSDPWNPTFYGDPETFTCKAIVEEWSARFVNEGLVNAKDVKVLVLASTLATEPKPLDWIEITGRGRFRIIPESAGLTGVAPVSTDPAKAVWTLRARA